MTTISTNNLYKARQHFEALDRNDNKVADELPINMQGRQTTLPISDEEFVDHYVGLASTGERNKSLLEYADLTLAAVYTANDNINTFVQQASAQTQTANADAANARTAAALSSITGTLASMGTIIPAIVAPGIAAAAVAGLVPLGGGLLIAGVVVAVALLSKRSWSTPEVPQNLLKARLDAEALHDEALLQLLNAPAEAVKAPTPPAQTPTTTPTTTPPVQTPTPPTGLLTTPT